MIDNIYLNQLCKQGLADCVATECRPYICSGCTAYNELVDLFIELTKKTINNLKDRN